MKFLDDSGLSTFWNNCKSWFGSKVSASKTGNNITVSLYGKTPGQTAGTNEDILLNSTTLSMSKSPITTAAQGTAIPADDITAWSTGSLPSLTISNKSISPVAGFDSGTRPSLTITDTTVLSGYEITPTTGVSGSMDVSDGVLSISFDQVVTNVSGTETTTSVGSGSAWSAGTAPSLSLGESVTIGSAESWNAGTLPALSYDAKSIPNISIDSGTSVVTDISVLNE